MVYQNKIYFGTKSLKILTLENINIDIEKNIGFLLKNLSETLNHKIENSIAKKFNDAHLNVPVYLNKEFIDFLEYNIDFYLFFNGRFNPFPKMEYHSEIRKLFIKDLDEETIIKLKDLKLDTGSLRLAYVFELLKMYLKEKSIVNYLITTPFIIFSSGDIEWETKFVQSEVFGDTTFIIKNSNALLVQSLNSGTIFEEFIIFSKNLGLLKVIEEEARNLTLDKVSEFVRKYNVDIGILENESIKVIKPS